MYALYFQSQALNSAIDYYNDRLPNQLTTDHEIGFKTALLNGHLVVNGSVFRNVVSNSAVFSGQTNPQGVGYYLNEGTTTNEGWDGSAALAVFNGLQLITTWYNGTVKNQADVWVSPGYANSWSAFARWDFPKTSALKGLAVGAGANKIGKRYLTTGGLTFPKGFPAPATGFFAIQSAPQAEVFAEYQISHNTKAYLNVTNLFNEQYGMGTQSPGIIDAAPPRSGSVDVTYSF